MKPRISILCTLAILVLVWAFIATENSAYAQAAPNITACPSKQCSPTPFRCVGDKCRTVKSFCWCGTPYQATNTCTEVEQKCCDEFIPLIDINAPCHLADARALRSDGVNGIVFLAGCRPGFVLARKTHIRKASS
jgi:hypothetical protein